MKKKRKKKKEEVLKFWLKCEVHADTSTLLFLSKAEVVSACLGGVKPDKDAGKGSASGQEAEVTGGRNGCDLREKQPPLSRGLTVSQFAGPDR